MGEGIREPFGELGSVLYFALLAVNVGVYVCKNSTGSTVRLVYFTECFNSIKK